MFLLPFLAGFWPVRNGQQKRPRNKQKAVKEKLKTKYLKTKLLAGGRKIP